MSIIKDFIDEAAVALSITTAQTGTLASGDLWLADSSVIRTRALPAAPEANVIVVIKDDTGLAATNNITISRNGSNIQGLAEDLIVNVNFAKVKLQYTGTEWRIVS